MSKMHPQDLILAARFMFNKKSFILVGKMALQIKVLAIRADNSSSALRTHVVEGQNRLPQVVLCSTQGQHGECPHIHASSFLHEAEYIMQKASSESFLVLYREKNQSCYFL